MCATPVWEEEAEPRRASAGRALRMGDAEWQWPNPAIVAGAQEAEWAYVRRQCGLGGAGDGRRVRKFYLVA